MEVNAPKTIEFPPSNKKYEKNGKKVKSNIGNTGKLVLSGMLAGSAISPYVSDVFNESKRLRNLLADKEIAMEHNKQGMIEKCEIGIKKAKAGIRSAKIGICAVIPIAVGISLAAITLVNHFRNEKRTKLFNEPRQNISKI